ncbi:MAG: hypothetical protein K2L84_05475, partial [Muribaculaceae bacterium]|nr:hypothetical protein [Muribaculaceae bacterium]
MKSIILYITLLLTLLCLFTSTVKGRSAAVEELDSTFAERIELLPESTARIVSEPAVAFPESEDNDSIYTVPATVSDTLHRSIAKSRMRYEKTDLDATVNFSAADSMLIVGRDSAFMYGTAAVSYGSIKLDAAKIEMDLNDNTVFAVGVPDSTGKVEGKPVFNDNGTDYEAATMRYNFRSQKGFITNVVTQQGEGYLTGGRTKKSDEKEFYIEDGFYTTCDHHDSPHFGFHITKGK